MSDDAFEEILEHERKSHRRDIIFAAIVAMIAIATVIALRMASDESQKGPSHQQAACETSPYC